MQTGSLMNHLYANAKHPEPTVGMGATICGWTDRDGATVVAVGKNGKSVTVQEDTATRTDNNGMSDMQSYSHTPNPEASRQTFTLRKNGRWVREGSAMGQGTTLSLGHRSTYYDYSF
jgi:hypothetical protein